MFVRILALGLLLSTPIFAQETRSFTDDAGRVVEVPVKAERIASLDDMRITIPLIELGILPTASHGRPGESAPYIRGSKLLTGVDFDNAPVTFLGNDLDIEALVQSQPDLIITVASRDLPVDQLERIAPTIVLDAEVADYLGMYERLADLTGTEDRLALLDARYQAQLEQVRYLIGPENWTISVFSGSEGTITVPHSYGSLGIMLHDAGFDFPAIYDDIAPGTEIDVSAEYLPELDADIIIDSFRNDRNETAADADARMREVLDGYCEALWACSNGQMFVVPRDEIYAVSYASLSTAVNYITALMMARDLQQRPE